ncbi:hypothetical protein [Malikia granosa]|jgi:hypothetical protein|uniref:hypothetical protein n=1 Tax=Malikia granosa TaxID=263067 RepID=UPI0011B032BD|nr:hypothetical protein [Malikia granosa]
MKRSVSGVCKQAGFVVNFPRGLRLRWPQKEKPPASWNLAEGVRHGGTSTMPRLFKFVLYLLARMRAIFVELIVVVPLICHFEMLFNKWDVHSEARPLAKNT